MEIHIGYSEALIGKRMTENNITNADRREGRLLEDNVGNAFGQQDRVVIPLDEEDSFGRESSAQSPV